MIFDRDLFARLALFPKFLAPNSRVFDIALLLHFSGMEGGKWFAMSVANRTALRTDELVHAYGCRAAVHADKDFEKRKSRPPNELEEAHYYLGFYDLEWGAAKNAPLLYHDVSIRWKPENGEDAHFQIELLPKRGVTPTPKQWRSDRVAIRGAMSSALRGPSRHLCERDAKHQDTLEAIVLDPFPA